MDCQDALDLLHEIIDKEASEIDTREVKAHLEKCRDCFQKYQLEESVQAFINEKLAEAKNESLPSDKLTFLKNSITERLDEIDCESKNSSKVFKFSMRTIMATASLVILVGAAYFSAGYLRHYNTFGPIESAHFNAEDNINLYSDNIATDNVMNVLTADYHYQPEENLNDYRLVGGRVEEVDGVPMNHLVYENGGGTVVSLFVVSADKFQIPNSIENTQQALGDGFYYSHHCHGCDVVYYHHGSLIFITTTTDHSLELTEFIPPNAI